MLFAAGVGIGLSYFGVAEPIFHMEPKGKYGNRYVGRCKILNMHINKHNKKFEQSLIIFCSVMLSKINSFKKLPKSLRNHRCNRSTYRPSRHLPAQS